MISGALFFTLIVNTIASLQIFSEVYTMYFGTQQNAAGPAAEAALFYSILLFSRFIEPVHTLTVAAPQEWVARIHGSAGSSASA